MATHTTGGIKPPNFQTATFLIRGNAPYVQNKFSAKAREMIHETQAAGSRSKKGKARDGKDFQAVYEGAIHRFSDGGYGLPAPAFRNGTISACRLAGFQMTRAKLSIFVVQDGFDADDGSPLIRITKGEPGYSELPVRNETGVIDLRPRPMWQPGWEAMVTIKYDGDQFSREDLHNLMIRVGLQVGIGEGRPDSKSSNGCGWGTFDVELMP